MVPLLFFLSSWSLDLYSGNYREYAIERIQGGEREESGREGEGGRV